MRKPTDICLLCKVNLAIKTNSHIYPKFLSTNFLGAKGTPRRGYDLSSDKVLTNKPWVMQDSPKERYILCEECEAFFSVLEGIASDTFINWKFKVGNDQYSMNKVIDGLDIVECNTADKKTVFLFIYSIFWRVSVSAIEDFKNLKISNDFEEELRRTLMAYKQINKADYLSTLGVTPVFEIFPSTIMTAKSFIDETANILFAPFSYDPNCITVDRFKFMLFRMVDDVKPDIFKSLSNLKIDDCRIMIFSEKV